MNPTRSTASITQETLTVTERPTWEQLHVWWDAMWNNPEDIRVAFSDVMPRSLPRFLESDVMLVLLTVGSDCVAGIWLHDLERVHGHVTACLVCGLIAPPWRGVVGCAAAKLALASFQARGVQHIFAAINLANRASIALTVGQSMLGFTRVMRYPGFLPYQGTDTDCLIATWHAEDVARAKGAAARRARHVARLRAAPGGIMTTRVRQA